MNKKMESPGGAPEAASEEAKQEVKKYIEQQAITLVGKIVDKKGAIKFGGTENYTNEIQSNLFKQIKENLNKFRNDMLHKLNSAKTKTELNQVKRDVNQEITRIQLVHGLGKIPKLQMDQSVEELSMLGVKRKYGLVLKTKFTNLKNKATTALDPLQDLPKAHEKLIRAEASLLAELFIKVTNQKKFDVLKNKINKKIKELRDSI